MYYMGRSRERVAYRSRERSRSREHSLERLRRDVPYRSRERTRRMQRSSEERSRGYSCDLSRDLSLCRSREPRRYDSSWNSRDRSKSQDLREVIQKLHHKSERVRNRNERDVYVPTFDPSWDNANIEEWIERVEKLSRSYGWSTDTVTRMVAPGLKGEARQIYDDEVRQNCTWSELKGALRMYFQRLVPFSRLLCEAANYKAQPGQKLSDYCSRKVEKLRALRLNIPDEYLRDAVIGGIDDVYLAMTIKSIRCGDVRELHAAMNKMGSMSERSSGSGTESGPSSSSNDVQPEPMARQRLIAKPSRKRPAEVFSEKSTKRTEETPQSTSTPITYKRSKTTRHEEKISRVTLNTAEMDTICDHPDRSVKCPYDASHAPRASGLQIHLLKCEQNHPNTKIVKCPYDVTHRMDRSKLKEHMATCPRSGNVKISEYTMQHEKRLGEESLKAACAKRPPVIDDEDWN